MNRVLAALTAVIIAIGSAFLALHDTSPTTSAPSVQTAAVAQPVPIDRKEEFAHRASRSRALPSASPHVVHSPRALKKRVVHRAVHKPAVVRHYSASSLKGYAESLVGAAQFSCLEPLWEHESGWNVTAASSSGAYGIPQALPGSKMASEGADWRTNGRTQIRWGVGYIDSRYGSPCAAYSHWRSHNWY